MVYISHDLSHHLNVVVSMEPQKDAALVRTVVLNLQAHVLHLRV